MPNVAVGDMGSLNRGQPKFTVSDFSSFCPAHTLLSAVLSHEVPHPFSLKCPFSSNFFYSGVFQHLPWILFPLVVCHHPDSHHYPGKLSASSLNKGRKKKTLRNNSSCPCTATCSFSFYITTFSYHIMEIYTEEEVDWVPLALFSVTYCSRIAGPIWANFLNSEESHIMI